MRNKAQSMLEYVLVVAVIIAGLTLMQLYVKRAVQGKLKDLANQIGQQGYAPGRNTLSDFSVDKTYTTIEEVGSGNAATYMGYTDPATGETKGSAEVTTRHGYEKSWEDTQ